MSYRSQRERNTIIKECCDRNQTITVQIETTTGDTPDDKPSIDIPNHFTHEKFMDIRGGVGIDGEPWFVGKDVALALGHKRPSDAIKQHCKGAVIYRPLQTPGGTQSLRVIGQADVNRLIMRSNLPEAEEFKDWVADIVALIQKDGFVDLRVNQGTKGKADTVNQYQDPSISMSMSGLGHLVERNYGAKIQMQMFTRYITGVVTCQSLDGDTEISPDYTEMFMMKGRYVAVKWNSLIEAEAWIFNHIDNCHGGIDIDRFVIKDRGEKNLRLTEK